MMTKYRRKHRDGITGGYPVTQAQISSAVEGMPCQIAHANQSFIWCWFLFALLLFLVIPRLSVASMPTFKALPAIDTSLWLPTAVAVGPDEKIYVAEPDRNRVFVFTGAGKLLRALSGLDMPVAIAVDFNGNLYVGNAGRGNVEVYGPDLVLAGVLGAGDNEFRRPAGIAIDSSGSIYVVDSRLHQVRVFNPDYSSKTSFGSSGTGNGQFRLPTSVAVVDNGETGELYVPDLSVVGANIDGYAVSLARVQVFDLNGNYLRSFQTVGKDSTGKPYDFMRPLGIAVDTLDRIYLTDAYQSVVTVYSNSGVYLGKISDENHPLRNPLGLAFAPESSRLFVASLNTGTVETFGIDRDYGDINISPGAYDFGSISVGDSATEFSFVVSNVGSADLAVDASTLIGLNAGEFAIQSDGCASQTLNPSAECTIDVLFNPISGGSKTATLLVASDDLYAPTMKMSLEGEGLQEMRALTVATIGTGRGSVQGTGIDCGIDCDEDYAIGSVVTLTAEASPGSSFSGWSGGCNGTGSCMVTMAQALAVVAKFTVTPALLATYTVTATAGDHGSISPEGDHLVNAGETLICIITADTGYRIANVLVDGVSVGAVDSFTFDDLNANHTIVAEFLSTSALLLSSIEMGELAVDHEWTQVVLTKPFVDPVIVAKPASLNDDEPAVIRVRNVTAIGFELRVQEWDYLDGIHGEERISYIVMERGRHTLNDGTQVEAGQFDTSRTVGFDTVSFSQMFSTEPVVIASITSVNGGDAVVGRITAIGLNDFKYKLQEQEKNAKHHISETVSYIAWEESQGTSDGVTFEVSNIGKVVNHEFQPISFSATYVSPPLFIADMQTVHGNDTANLRWKNKSTLSVSIQVDEEQSRNQEVVHWDEAVGYVALYSASAVPAVVADSDGDGLSDKDEVDTYKTDPSVSDTDGDGMDDAAELVFWGGDWNADPDGDKVINLLDDDSDNDGHTDGAEQAAGTDPADPTDFPSLAPSTFLLSSIETGDVTVDHEWVQVVLTKTFVNPVVIAKPASLNDDEPAVVRVRNVTASGFELRVQEWDYLDGIHGEERVSYIVMERGRHTLDDGTQVEVGQFSTNQTAGFDTVNFSKAFSTEPVVIASITSVNGGDTVVGRIKAIGLNDFEYKLQEQENNAKYHMTEMVSYIAWEQSQGTSDGVRFEVSNIGQVVNHEFQPISYSATYVSPPLFIADMQTVHGNNTANLRWQSKSAQGVNLQVDEEQSRDQEVRHWMEAVGYIVVEMNSSP